MTLIGVSSWKNHIVPTSCVILYLCQYNPEPLEKNRKLTQFTVYKYMAIWHHISKLGG